MAMNKPMKVIRRKKSNLIPVLIMLVFALLLSLLIAGVWQISAGAQGENASSDASRQRLRSSSSEPEEKEESSDDEPEPASAPKPEPEPEIPVFEGAVPASDWVSSDYFNDAVFVGDSISTGIELYGVMDGTTVLAGTGANLSSIYTSPCLFSFQKNPVPIHLFPICPLLLCDIPCGFSAGQRWYGPPDTAFGEPLSAGS